MNQRHGPCRAICLGTLLLAFTCSVTGPAARAQDDQRVTLGVWRVADGPERRESLLISLTDQITRKQKKLVNAGFTTLSLLEIKILPSEGADPDDHPLTVSIRCTVAYDDWEENYDVALLATKPQTALVKSFDDYAGMCLVGEITRAADLRRLAPRGGALWARLVLQQTSREEAREIKTWLVEQQSGVMQRLFSHMLGDLTLSQVLTVRVTVPPRPPTPQPPAGRPSGGRRGGGIPPAPGGRG